MCHALSREPYYVTGISCATSALTSLPNELKSHGPTLFIRIGAPSRIDPPTPLFLDLVNI